MAIGGSGVGLILRITADANKAIAEFRRLGTTVNTETNRMTTASRTGFAQAGAASDRMGGSFQTSARGAIAMGSAALGAVTGIVLLAKNATEAADQLYDMSLQTNIQVETLSALKNAADFSGSSIEGLSAALGIFQKNMVKAQEEGSKMQGVFKALNIDVNDNEKALRDAFRALYAMEKGAKQTDTALQLFGRSGTKVLGVLIEMNGNLDEAIKKYREMGIEISTGAAKSAAEFNDQMQLLWKQLQVVGLAISKVLMPTLKGLAAMVDTLTKAFRGWGLAIDWALNKFSNFVKAQSGGPPGWAATEAVKNIQSAFGSVVPGGDLDLGGGGGGKSKAVKDTAFENEVKAARLAEQMKLEALAWTTFQLKREYEVQVLDIKQYTEEALKLADEKFNATIDAINRELIALQSSLQTKKEIAEREAELDLETTKAVRDRNEERSRLEDERDKKIAQAELDARSREVKMQEEADRRIIERLRHQGEVETMSRSAIESQVKIIIEEGYARRKKLLEEEEASFATSAQRRAEINDDLIRLDGERAGAAEDAARRIQAARTAEFLAGEPAAPTDGKTIDYSIEKGPPKFDAWKAAISDLKTMALDAFHSMGEAMGQAVGAWVLYGNQGENVLKKILASVLASIAAEAAIRSIFELAKGFASLFFNPAEAVAHFKAAGLFAVVAGTSAIAGRAIAGNSFNGQGAGASGGGLSGGSNSSTQQNKPTPIDANRRAGEIAIRVDIRRDPGSIVEVFVDDYQKNGKTRQLIGGGALAMP